MLADLLPSSCALPFSGSDSYCYYSKQLGLVVLWQRQVNCLSDCADPAYHYAKVHLLATIGAEVGQLALEPIYFQ